MKKFFQDGLDTIIKMVVTQLGMTMFGLMLTMTTKVIPGSAEKTRDPLLLAVGFVSVFMYLFLLYTHIWEKGAKDRIKVDGGRMVYQPLKGLWLSLVANSLNIILGVTMCITYYLCDFAANTDSIAYQIFGSANDIARMIQGMYTSFILYISPDAKTTSPFLFLAIVLPALLISGFGYYLGVSNRKLFKTNTKSSK